MFRIVKLQGMDGSVGVDIPANLAERFNLAVGDVILAVETADGILLRPYDPNVEEGLRIAAEAGRRYRDAFGKLSR